MKNSFIVLLFAAVFVQAQEKKDVKDMNWKECEERLSQGSAGLTEEDMKICKKKVFEKIKRQKFEELKRQELDPNYKPEPPQKRQKTFKELFEEDPEAANKLVMERILENEKKMLLQPIKEKYDGKYIDIELVASFDDEGQMNKYLEKERKIYQQGPVRSIRNLGGGIEPAGYQFVDENGKVIKEVKKASGKLSKEEREMLRPVLEKRLKQLKTPIPKRYMETLQDFIKDPPIRFETWWEIQQGFLIETIKYQRVYAPWGKLAYEKYDENYNYSSLYFSVMHSRTNIYDHNGALKTTLEGDVAADISPNKDYIIGLGMEYSPNTSKTLLTFYDIKGNTVRKLLFETPDPYFDPGISGVVIFSPNGKYVIPNLRDGSGIYTLTFLNNKGEALWEKKNGEPSYSKPVLVTNDGEVVTEDGYWIARDGSIVSKLEATPNWSVGEWMIDNKKRLIFTTTGLWHGQYGKPYLVIDIETGKVVDTIPSGGQDFFPSGRLKCIDNRFIRDLGKGSPHKAIYLYKVQFKK